MKKQWFIYILISLMFINVSCTDDSNGDADLLSPYTSLNSFSIGDLISYRDDVTAEGKDTVISSVVVGASYPFIIDQKSKEVYNPDSLPLGTNIKGVLANVKSDGVAFIYVDTLETFVYFSSSDSLDFTKPRRLLVQSLDGQYSQEYKVSLNVHKTDPDAMHWESSVAPNIAEPVRVIAYNDKMLVYGKDAEGVLVVAESPLDITSWSTSVALTTLPASAQLSSMQYFNDMLYVVADAGLYSSNDGVNWSTVAADIPFETLLTSSSNSLWAVANGSLVYTTDSKSFVETTALPKEFPVENVSSLVYPLLTNPFISRYILVGYAKERIPAYPVVWSKLSTEDTWVQYPADENEAYHCPSFENMTVLRYDGCLYAFGGKAQVGETTISPFEAFYISKDNGLTWHRLNDEKVVIPSQLKGVDAPYAATVDENNRMWIVLGGENGVVWRAAINRLLHN